MPHGDQAQQPAGPPAPLLRSDSLAAPPDGKSYRIGVKREPAGQGSGYLHEQVEVGDEPEPLDDAAAGQVLMCSARRRAPVTVDLQKVGGKE